MKLIKLLAIVSAYGTIFWACESDLKPELSGQAALYVPQKEAPNQTSIPTVSPMLRPPNEEDRCESELNYVAPNVIRRLTRIEYKNTVRDLLGLELANLVDSFPPEEEVNGFDNQSKSLQVSALHVEEYMQASENLAQVVVENFATLSPCVPMNEQAETCIRAFIENFGSRAWRRPIDETEMEQLLSLYRLGLQGAYEDMAHPQAHLLGPIDPFTDGLSLIVSAVLQSPHFLYRVEIGSKVSESYVDQDGQREPGAVRDLSAYELANRLSYLLWRSMPDDILFEAAANGELNNEVGLMAQAERMLIDPRASDGLWSFFEQWLAFDEIADINKDPAVFPLYNESLNQLFETELRLFVEDVVFSQRDMRLLFNSNQSFMNADLARHYARGGEGATLSEDKLEESAEWAFNASSHLSPEELSTARSDLPKGESFVKIELNPARRSGLMTRGGVLALTTKPNMGDPVHRGIYIRERLLCTPLPPPPPDIVVVAPDPDPSLTTREQFKIHSSEPACEGCHKLVDPLGFGLERFDPVGRFRELENGQEINDQGEIVSTLDIDGVFQGSQALGERLAESEQVQRCVVLNLMRYAQGRSESAPERCDIDQLYNEYSGANYDFLTLLRAIIRSPSFSRLHFDADELSSNIVQSEQGE